MVATQHRVGIVSDTHGLLRPEAIELLRGSDLILHAGDIGGPEVLAGLSDLAPLHAVRGNNDIGRWSEGLPLVEVVEVGEVRFHLVHELRHLTPPVAGERSEVVVCGHSHRPLAECTEGVLYINPGSAGPRRFRLPVSIALVHVRGREIEHEIHELDV